MARKESKAASSRSDAKRSGDFSSDPTFDPKELFESIEHEENLERVRDSMRRFIAHGDDELIARAIAVFVRSARTRGDSIESVLGTLESVADRSEGSARMGFRDSPLRRRILRGLLLAFYGSDTVEREAAARERRADQRDTT
jgi:hypothetical protein